MKHAILISFGAVLLTMLLPAVWSGNAPPPQPTAAVTLADSEIRFTVKTDEGIEATDMASYLPGVLAGEMPALFEPAALQAQAVAARTYILYRMTHGSAAHPEADICNSPSCCKAYAADSTLRQNWGDSYTAYHDKITAAVTATDGQVLTYGGDAIEAVFHSSSAGATESSGSVWNDRAYLVSVESPETAADVPGYVSEVCFSPQALQSRLQTAYPKLSFSDSPHTWLTDIRHNDSGRVQSVTLCGQTIGGAKLRSLLGLRSTAFTCDYTDGSFRFTVTGYGHGVGLSQYGANVFAKQGMDYAAILAHYYPGTQLTSAAG